MNKTKLTLVAIGGTAGLAILAAGVFVWMQFSARTAALEGDEDGTQGLETVEARADQLTRQKIRPSAESVKQLETAREEVSAWKEDAFRFAARGDHPIAKLTDAAFKEFLIQDSKRLLLLQSEAGSTNKVLESTFEFGLFKPYLVEGKMPEPENLKRLQRNWDDLSTILETLASAGVTRVTAIDVAKAATPVQEEQSAPKNKKKARKNKNVQEPTFKPESVTYTVACAMRPAALVKALNLFQTSERFMVVDDFSVTRGKDMLSASLTEKKEETATSSRRGRRGRGARTEEVAEEKPAADEMFSVVTDPVLDSPMDVKFTLTVHDLRSMEETPKEEEDKE